jgi:hypothetical protein
MVAAKQKLLDFYLRTLPLILFLRLQSLHGVDTVSSGEEGELTSIP